MQSLTCPAGMPRSASSSATVSLSATTCSALSTIGQSSPVSSGMTMASRSRTASRQGRLMRTSVSMPCEAKPRTMSGAAARAASLALAATESSRSRISPSAPTPGPFSMNFCAVAGMNSSERQTGRLIMRPPP